MEKIKDTVSKAMMHIQKTQDDAKAHAKSEREARSKLEEETDASNKALHDKAEKEAAQRKVDDEALLKVISERESKTVDPPEAKGERGEPGTGKLAEMVKKRLDDHQVEQKDLQTKAKEDSDQQTAARTKSEQEGLARKERAIAEDLKRTRYLFNLKEAPENEKGIIYQVDEVFIDKLKVSYHAFNTPKTKRLAGVKEFWDKMKVVGYYD